MGFLVLSRREHQKIEISNGVDTIVVAVSKIEGGSVKLAFDAPMHYHILRTELKEREHG